MAEPTGESGVTVNDLIRLAEYVRKQQNRTRRGRRIKKVTAFASLPFGAGLIVPDDWWKGNSR